MDFEEFSDCLEISCFVMIKARLFYLQSIMVLWPERLKLYAAEMEVRGCI